MDTQFMLYAMEQEGDLPTKLGKLNKFIKLMRLNGFPAGYDEQLELFSAANLDPSTLTSEDFDYIEKQLNN